MENKNNTKSIVNFEVQCPHCEEYVIIEQINCAIFRHGVIKKTLKQIDPHLPKAQCDKLKEHNLIYGCGKPFKIVNRNGIWISVECDYI